MDTNSRTRGISSFHLLVLAGALVLVLLFIARASAGQPQSFEGARTLGNVGASAAASIR